MHAAAYVSGSRPLAWTAAVDLFLPAASSSFEARTLLAVPSQPDVAVPITPHRGGMQATW